MTMVGWNSNYNWTYKQFNDVVHESLVKENNDSICLDTEHSDYNNEQQIVAWAKEAGYGAEVLDGGDKIRVYKIKKS